MNSTIKIDQHDRLYTFNFFLVVLDIIIVITPFLNRNFPKSLWVGVICLWFISSIVDQRFKLLLPKSILIITLWYLWSILLKIIGRSTAEIGNYFLILVGVDLIIKCYYIYNCYSRAQKQKLLRIIQVILLLNYGYNLVLWMINKAAFLNFYFYRELFEKTNKIESSNFYNMTAFIIGINLFLFLKEKGKSRILDIALVIIPLSFIILVNPRMNALILSTIMLLGIFFLDKKVTLGKLVLSIVFIFILIFALIWGQDIVLSIIDKRLLVRIESIFDLLAGRDVDVTASSLTRRLELQMVSLNTFTSSIPNFIVGAGLHMGTEYYSVIGQHGFVADTLGAYGLVGLVFLVALFGGWFNVFCSMYKFESSKRMGRVICFSFAVASIICSAFRMEILMGAFFLPSLVDSVCIMEER